MHTILIEILFCLSLMGLIIPFGIFIITFNEDMDYRTSIFLRKLLSVIMVVSLFTLIFSSNRIHFNEKTKSTEVKQDDLRRIIINITPGTIINITIISNDQDTAR